MARRTTSSQGVHQQIVTACFPGGPPTKAVWDLRPNQGAMFLKQPAPLHVGTRPAPSGCPPIRFRSGVRRALNSGPSRLAVVVRRFDAVVLLCVLTWLACRRQARSCSRSMALLPCRGQVHPHQLTSPLQQQPPSVTTFGREFGAARPLRLGRCAQRSRRLQPCGAWAGERWSRAFAAARSRARQFLQVTVHTSLLVHDGQKALLRQHTLPRVASTANVAVPRTWLLSTQLRHPAQDQQQHFQRPDADDTAPRDQATGARGSGDQQSSRSSSRPASRLQASEDSDGSREQAGSSAQPQDAAPAQLSIQDVEWEDWKAVRARSTRPLKRAQPA